jgi:hypothetical protein
VAVGFTALSSSASAQPSNPEAASDVQALYDDAVASMERKEFDVACPKLEVLVRRVPEGVGAKLTLAQCYEEAGRLATAWATYELAAEAAAEAKQVERRLKARARADALKPKLARLTITVAEATRDLPGLTIERDGVPIEPLKWGIPVPIDQGSHVIAATAPGKKRWEKTVEIAANGANEAMTVDALLDAPDAPVVAPERPRDWGNTRRIAGIGVGALGVIGLGAAAVFGVVAISTKDESNESHCDASNRCDGRGLALRSEAATAATVSTALFITGGLVFAGGVTLFLLPSSSAAPTGSKAQLALPAGAGLRGTW